MKEFYCFIVNNKDFIDVIIDIFVAFSSLLISIVSLRILSRQKEIMKHQEEMENSKGQPIFDIRFSQTQDDTDGKYGTEILKIDNIGTRTKSCEPSICVFFCLTKGLNRNTIYAKVDDYFCFTYGDYKSDKEIISRYTPGNNRIYCSGYSSAINDSRTGDAYYFYDRLILIRLKYKDIFEKTHTIYFKGKNEIDESEYQYYLDENRKQFKEQSFTLKTIDYYKLKEMVDNINK